MVGLVSTNFGKIHQAQQNPNIPTCLQTLSYVMNMGRWYPEVVVEDWRCPLCNWDCILDFWKGAAASPVF